MLILLNPRGMMEADRKSLLGSGFAGLGLYCAWLACVANGLSTVIPGLKFTMKRTNRAKNRSGCFVSFVSFVLKNGPRYEL